MANRWKTNLVKITASVTGATLLVGAGIAQPAEAATFQPGATFYTGADFTGKEIPVDLGNAQCVSLPAPAASAANLSSQNIAVYFNADCQQGAPGTTNDLLFILGGLHTANFPWVGVSYRVMTTK